MVREKSQEQKPDLRNMLTCSSVSWPRAFLQLLRGPGKSRRPGVLVLVEKSSRFWGS